MSDLPVSLLAIILITFFAAGAVKGVSGMGLPTLAMAVLGAILSPVAAASLLIIPSFVTNIWQLVAGPSFGATLRRLWPMMLSIVIATIFGVRLMTSTDTQTATVALGMTLIFYSLYTLFGRQFTIRRSSEFWLSPVIGIATGFVTGATGVFVIPAVPYLQALGLSRDDLVQALGLSFTVSTIALAASLGLQGAFRINALGLSLLAVIPALAGMWVGQIVRSRISQDSFRRGFLVCLLLFGVEMSVRPLL